MTKENRTTYSLGSSWEDSVLDIEELRRIVDGAMEVRGEFVSKVRRLVGDLRICPLIVRMYGGMAEAFGVDSFDRDPFFTPVDLKIEMPKRDCFFPVLLSGGVFLDRS